MVDDDDDAMSLWVDVYGIYTVIVSERKWIRSILHRVDARHELNHE